jgi:hypothetical protein
MHSNGKQPPPWAVTLLQAEDWKIPPWEVSGERMTNWTRIKWRERWTFFRNQRAVKEDNERRQWQQK